MVTVHARRRGCAGGEDADRRTGHDRRCDPPVGAAPGRGLGPCPCRARGRLRAGGSESPRGSGGCDGDGRSPAGAVMGRPAPAVHPGRGGRDWQRVRAQVLRSSSVCWLCGAPVDFDAPARSPKSPSVDHVLPLHAMRDLDRETQRRLALDPANLRVAHFGCNSGRRERRPAPQRKVSRRW